eukprot:CAMPEP_0194287764 /NCGR_PEP_ID=MMETSP0169-20130528/35443_1 /TAXON_ID=218684 /ORGANISM="Corethron pennatum, Strain L29A3" /LENGTH=1000 /DNA_ID=CAMNT_0039034567 /DNA_START=219 /DNA_END=3221 /DNA_ORIENTATION=+
MGFLSSLKSRSLGSEKKRLQNTENNANSANRGKGLSGAGIKQRKNNVTTNSTKKNAAAPGLLGIKRVDDSKAVALSGSTQDPNRKKKSRDQKSQKDLKPLKQSKVGLKQEPHAPTGNKKFSSKTKNKEGKKQSSSSKQQSAPKKSDKKYKEKVLTAARETRSFTIDPSRAAVVNHQANPDQSPCGFDPKQSRTVARAGLSMVADGDTWIEALAVSDDGKDGKVRSYFYSKKTRRRVWDEPPSGASNIVYVTAAVREMTQAQLKRMVEMRKTTMDGEVTPGGRLLPFSPDAEQDEAEATMEAQFQEEVQLALAVSASEVKPGLAKKTSSRTLSLVYHPVSTPRAKGQENEPDAPPPPEYDPEESEDGNENDAPLSPVARIGEMGGKDLNESREHERRKETERHESREHEKRKETERHLADVVARAISGVTEKSEPSEVRTEADSIENAVSEPAETRAEANGTAKAEAEPVEARSEATATENAASEPAKVKTECKLQENATYPPSVAYPPMVKRTPKKTPRSESTTTKTSSPKELPPSQPPNIPSVSLTRPPQSSHSLHSIPTLNIPVDNQESLRKEEASFETLFTEASLSTPIKSKKTVSFGHGIIGLTKLFKNRSSVPKVTMSNGYGVSRSNEYANSRSTLSEDDQLTYSSSYEDASRQVNTQSMFTGISGGTVSTLGMSVSNTKSKNHTGSKNNLDLEMTNSSTSSMLPYEPKSAVSHTTIDSPRSRTSSHTTTDSPRSRTSSHKNTDSPRSRTSAKTTSTLPSSNRKRIDVCTESVEIFVDNNDDLSVDHTVVTGDSTTNKSCGKVPSLTSSVVMSSASADLRRPPEEKSSKDEFPSVVSSDVLSSTSADLRRPAEKKSSKLKDKLPSVVSSVAMSSASSALPSSVKTKPSKIKDKKILKNNGSSETKFDSIISQSCVSNEVDKKINESSSGDSKSIHALIEKFENKKFEEMPPSRRVSSASLIARNKSDQKRVIDRNVKSQAVLSKSGVATPKIESQ